MAEYLQRIRRLSAGLFVSAVLLVFAVAQVPSQLPIRHGEVYLLLASALVTGVVVYFFPWPRYHPNWFLVVGVLGTGMIALLIYLTGGRASIFHPLFVFVIVASGAYYAARPLTFIVLLVSLASLSYVLYAPAVTREDLLRSAVAIGIWTVSAYLCHAIFRGLERSTEDAQHYAQTLAVSRDLDLLQLANSHPAETAGIALRRFRDVVPYEAGWVATVEDEPAGPTWIAGEPAARTPPVLPEGSSWREAALATREGPEPLPDEAASCLLQGLFVAEVLIGVLVLARSAGAAWSGRDRRTVAQLAGQLALGLERGRWVEQGARIEAQQALARMKEEFVAHVSHELRNPLTMLLGGAELLASGRAAPAQAPALAQHVHTAAVQLKSLVDDVLNLATGERAGWELEQVPCDLVQLLEEAVGVVAGPEERGRVTIEAPPLPRLHADPARLRQVFANLIGNALKYSPRGGTVSVACDSVGDEVEVRVVDQGVGIPPEALDRVFEKFYRAPNELARAIPGTGLGLAITRQLVEAHGGRIWVESAGVGKGSTFGVRLPVPAGTTREPEPVA